MSNADYREAHREELAAKQRAWREAHPDYMKKYRAENAEAIAATQREWRQAHQQELNDKRRIAKGDRAVRRRERLEATAEERRVRRLARIREWRRNHPEKVERYRRYNQTRKARLLGAFVEKVDRFRVYDQWSGICGICALHVSRERFDVDHIIPLSRGGEHSYANCQPAHPTCNTRKHNRLPAENARGALASAA